MSNPLLESEYGYVRARPQIWVKDSSMSLVSQVDALVLDVDGVLINVTNSFRVVISQTVQHYFFRILGFTGDAVLVKPSETQLFKLAGGFNNDWDLTSAAVLFYLAKAELTSAADLDVIREQGQSLDEFTAAVRRVGGGIEGVREVLWPVLTREQRKAVEKRWNRPVIEETFQELYGGVDHCQRLYGFKPSYNRRIGLVNDERVMIQPESIKPWLPKVGILTGRTAEETELALELTGLKDLISPENIISDGAMSPEKRKPQPEVLLELGRRLGGSVTAYVGDVLDDLLLVRNANRCPECPSVYISCMVVSPLRRAEVEFYQIEGADVIGMNVNEVLKAMRK